MTPLDWAITIAAWSAAIAFAILAISLALFIFGSIIIGLQSAKRKREREDG